MVGEFIDFKGRRSSKSSSIPMRASIRWSGPGQAYDEMITGDHITARHDSTIRLPDASKCSRKNERDESHGRVLGCDGRSRAAAARRRDARLQAAGNRSRARHDPRAVRRRARNPQSARRRAGRISRRHAVLRPGPALVCTLPPGHFAPTIELKVNFIKPAPLGCPDRRRPRRVARRDHRIPRGRLRTDPVSSSPPQPKQLASSLRAENVCRARHLFAQLPHAAVEKQALPDVRGLSQFHDFCVLMTQQTASFHSKAVDATHPRSHFPTVKISDIGMGVHE